MSHPFPMMRPSRRVPVALAAAVALLATLVSAQEPDPPVSRPGGPPPDSPPQLPQGMTEEQMWPAPTEEDWQRPVQIVFQRSWEDAVAVSQETGKPILICINMDGEIASEHYAGIRYRSPEIAKMYEPYVCVIASVYRHTPRDHDENGHRIPCPRFGSVTCGEHIEIEPFLYERYMDGRRISPRHIMVELDGRETYDIFFAWDTDSVFTTISDGIANRAIQPNPLVRGDRTIVERVASRDIQDRVAVENAYIEGDRELRRRLLDAAREHPDAVPVELLRLSVFGFDAELGKVAREALAKVESPAAVDLISEALRVPTDDAERESLVAALERISAASPRARNLAIVHRGLETSSENVDVAGWSTAMRGGATYAPRDWTAVESRVEESAAKLRAKPDDADAQLELAEASLQLAVDPETTKALSADPRTATRFAKLMFEDARTAALEAQRLGAAGWRLDALLALTAYYLGDEAEAHARAIAAVGDMPPDPTEWNAIATLALFAQARQRAIWDALRAKTDWPREWMTDVNSVYSVLARHPLGTDQHAVTHYDFLNSLGAKGRAARVLSDGLARFPESWVLHDRLRERTLAERGVGGLELAYEAMLVEEGTSKNLEWFAGYASIVAAEFHRRAGDADQAAAAYGRAIAHYERAIEANPDSRATSDHYVALVRAGEARLAIERGELERALDHLVASFERCPEAAASLDGLNVSPAMTARLLLAQLKAADRTELVARLETAMAELDPAMLELPEYERIPEDRGGRRRGGRRGR